MKHLKRYIDFPIEERLLHKEEYIIKILNDNGYNIIKPLSGGCFGYTYELEDNKVCKVCYDRSEIEVANILIGKKNKYLVNYFDVFEGKDFDIIIMEKLDTNVNKNKLYKAETLLSKVGQWSNPDIGDIVFDEIPNIVNYIGHILFNSYLLDIVRMYIECSKYGMLNLDKFHKNFGIKNGHLVAFDFKIWKKKISGNKIKKLIETEQELENSRESLDQKNKKFKQ